MKKLIRLSFIALAAIMLSSGCATIHKGATQRVPITSEPAGASVIIDNRQVGTTPLTVSLPRGRDHQVTVARPGYHSQNIFFMAVPNEAADATVRFGMDQDLGADHDLVPGRFHARLDPLILPTRIGADPVRELAAKVVEVDELLRRGEIDVAEHRYIVSRLTEAYRGLVCR